MSRLVVLIYKLTTWRAIGYSCCAFVLVCAVIAALYTSVSIRARWAVSHYNGVVQFREGESCFAKDVLIELLPPTSTSIVVHSRSGVTIVSATVSKADVAPWLARRQIVTRPIVLETLIYAPDGEAALRQKAITNGTEMSGQFRTRFGNSVDVTGAYDSSTSTLYWQAM